MAVGSPGYCAIPIRRLFRVHFYDLDLCHLHVSFHIRGNGVSCIKVSDLKQSIVASFASTEVGTPTCIDDDRVCPVTKGGVSSLTVFTAPRTPNRGVRVEVSRLRVPPLQPYRTPTVRTSAPSEEPRGSKVDRQHVPVSSEINAVVESPHEEDHRADRCS